MSSLQLSEGLREDVTVEIRQRQVVTLQGNADAERVVNSLGKNGGRFAVEVEGQEGEASTMVWMVLGEVEPDDKWRSQFWDRKRTNYRFLAGGGGGR